MTTGIVKQFKGPFQVQTRLPIPSNQACTISISIGEKDLMQLDNFLFNINGNEIQMGKTGMYETGCIIDNAEVSFPKGAPLSTIVDIIYYNNID